MRGGEDVSCKKAKVKIQKLKSLKGIHTFLVDSNFIVSKVGQDNGKDVGVGPKVDRSCYSGKFYLVSLQLAPYPYI